MKVKVEMKITVLEGEEAGRTFTEKAICDTEQQITEYGILEQLRLKWNYIHNAINLGDIAKKIVEDVEDSQVSMEEDPK